MNTIEQLRADLKDAMRAKNEITTTTIRSILAACTNELVSKGRKPTDALDEKEIVAVLKRLAKQRKEAAEQFTQGNRPELAEKEIHELAVIEKYLPQMAGEAEIQAAVEAVLADIGKDPAKTGIITGMAMKKLGGNADGNMVKEIVAKLLN